MKKLILGAVMAIVLFCSLGFYDSTNFVNEKVWLDDDCEIAFGDDKDFEIYSDTTGILEFDPLIAGYTIYFGTAHTDAVNIKWFSDADGDFVTFDEENVEVLFTDVDLQLDDDAKFLIGTVEATDATLNWDNTNAELDLTVPVGSIHFTLTAVPDAQYGFEVGSTIAGGTASEGSAAYFHTSLTGNIDAPTYNLGSWLDVTAGTPTSSALLVGIEAGVYVSATPTLTAADIAVLQIQYMGNSSSTCDIVSMIRVNSLQAASGGEAPDYFIWAGNDESLCLTPDSSTGATKVGAIKVNSAESGTMYIWTYDSTGS